MPELLEDMQELFLCEQTQRILQQLQIQLLHIGQMKVKHTQEASQQLVNAN